MNNIILEEINNRTIEILEFSLSQKDNNANLLLSINVENYQYFLNFTNVSRVNVKNLSLPFQIEGFCIEKNDDLGWATDSKYHIYDFEEGKFDFYCEDYSVAKRS